MKMIRTAAVLVECQSKILLLHRNANRSEGNTWALPAGSIEQGESDKEAALRELFEETGFVAKDSDVSLLHVFGWNFPHASVHFPVFKLMLENFYDVVLSPSEHQGYMWITPEDAYLRDDLIYGVHEVLQKAYSLSSQQ